MQFSNMDTVMCYDLLFYLGLLLFTVLSFVLVEFFACQVLNSYFPCSVRVGNSCSFS